MRDGREEMERQHLFSVKFTGKHRIISYSPFASTSLEYDPIAVTSLSVEIRDEVDTAWAREKGGSVTI